MKRKLAYFGIFRQTPETGKYYLKSVRNADGKPFLNRKDAVDFKNQHYRDCTVLPLNSPLLKD